MIGKVAGASGAGEAGLPYPKTGRATEGTEKRRCAASDLRSWLSLDRDAHVATLARQRLLPRRRDRIAARRHIRRPQVGQLSERLSDLLGGATRDLGVSVLNRDKRARLAHLQTHPERGPRAHTDTASSVCTRRPHPCSIRTGAGARRGGGLAVAVGAPRACKWVRGRRAALTRTLAALPACPPARAPPWCSRSAATG
eukprot:6609590-Prymnesium_polylepis.2